MRIIVRVVREYKKYHNDNNERVRYAPHDEIHYGGDENNRHMNVIASIKKPDLIQFNFDSFVVFVEERNEIQQKH